MTRISLNADLVVPPLPKGLVLFAHGSGSGRLSPRNRAVASDLNHGHLATLLFDLLTPAEEAARANVFDIELLAGRLADATVWAMEQPQTEGLRVGYFGASTGAAAALLAAIDFGPVIGAVVSRGGRPDLVGDRLKDVSSPTLLIVGSLDRDVVELNRQAQARMRCQNSLEVVAGASHLFEEEGALGRVAELAQRWFESHLMET